MKLLTQISLFGILLTTAGPALAADAFDVFLFGAAPVVAEVMTSIKGFLTDSGYVALFRLFGLIGLIVMATGTFMRIAVKPEQLIGYIIMFFVIQTVLFQAKMNLIIQDPVNDAVAAANNTSGGMYEGGTYDPNIVGVPVAIAFPIAFISSLSYYLTDIIESNLSSVNTNSNYTTLTGSNRFNMMNVVLRDMTTVKITEPQLRASMAAYTTNCFVPSLWLGEKNARHLRSEPDLWAYMDTNDEGRLTTYYPISFDPTEENSQGVLTDCDDAHTLIAQDIQNVTPSLYGARGDAFMHTDALNVYNGMFTEVARMSGLNSTVSGNELVRRNAVLNTFKFDTAGSFNPASGDLLFEVSTSEAKEAQRSQWRVSAEVFMETIGYIYIVLQIFVFAIAPIILFLVLIPGMGKKIIMSYMIVLLWISLWQPLLSVVNFMVNSITMIYMKRVVRVPDPTGSGSMNEFVLMNIGEVTLFADNMILASSFLATLVPMISLGILKGGEMALTQFASDAIAPGHSSKAAQQVASGNLKYDDVQIGNRSLEQQRLGRSVDLGTTLTGGPTESFGIDNGAKAMLNGAGLNPTTLLSDGASANTGAGTVDSNTNLGGTGTSGALRTRAVANTLGDTRSSGVTAMGGNREIIEQGYNQAISAAAKVGGSSTSEIGVKGRGLESTSFTLGGGASLQNFMKAWGGASQVQAGAHDAAGLTPEQTAAMPTSSVANARRNFGGILSAAAGGALLTTLAGNASAATPAQVSQDLDRTAQLAARLQQDNPSLTAEEAHNAAAVGLAQDLAAEAEQRGMTPQEVAQERYNQNGSVFSDASVLAGGVVAAGLAQKGMGFLNNTESLSGLRGELRNQNYYPAPGSGGRGAPPATPGKPIGQQPFGRGRGPSAIDTVGDMSKKAATRNPLGALLQAADLKVDTSTGSQAVTSNESALGTRAQTALDITDQQQVSDSGRRSEYSDISKSVSDLLTQGTQVTRDGARTQQDVMQQESTSHQDAASTSDAVSSGVQRSRSVAGVATDWVENSLRSQGLGVGGANMYQQAGITSNGRTMGLRLPSQAGSQDFRGDILEEGNRRQAATEASVNEQSADIVAEQQRRQAAATARLSSADSQISSEEKPLAERVANHREEAREKVLEAIGKVGENSGKVDEAIESSQTVAAINTAATVIGSANNASDTNGIARPFTNLVNGQERIGNAVDDLGANDTGPNASREQLNAIERARLAGRDLQGGIGDFLRSAQENVSGAFKAGLETLDDIVPLPLSLSTMNKGLSNPESVNLGTNTDYAANAEAFGIQRLGDAQVALSENYFENDNGRVTPILYATTDEGFSFQAIAAPGDIGPNNQQGVGLLPASGADSAAMAKFVIDNMHDSQIMAEMSNTIANFPDPGELKDLQESSQSQAHFEERLAERLITGKSEVIESNTTPQLLARSSSTLPAQGINPDDVPK